MRWVAARRRKRADGGRKELANAAGEVRLQATAAGGPRARAAAGSGANAPVWRRERSAAGEIEDERDRVQASPAAQGVEVEDAAQEFGPVGIREGALGAPGDRSRGAPAPA